MPRRSDCSVSDSRIRQGTPCVDYLVKHLPYTLLHHPCFEDDLESALVHSFAAMDEKLRTAIGDESGSCAVVALLRGGHLFVANLGDSRALLFELPATQLLQVLSAPGTTVTVFYWHWAATAGMTASTRKGTTYSVVSTRRRLTLIPLTGSA